MLYFQSDIRFIRIALRYHKLEHLIQGIELDGCWEEAAIIVSQIKDNVPVGILHSIYDTIDTPEHAYAALENIDKTYQPWRNTVATSAHWAYYALMDIDSAHLLWRETVNTVARQSYLALRDIDSEYEPWRKTVATDAFYSRLALRDINSEYKPWLETVG